jgi:cytidine deaminase
MSQDQVSLDKELEKKLLEAAKKSRENAYAPYSHFKVGAAFISKNSGSLYSGCNVENASYGATICAERGALMQGVAAEGNLRVEKLLVYTEADPPAFPCALCLQVLSEFTDPETEVLSANKSGIIRRLPFKDLLPHPFNEIP